MKIGIVMQSPHRIDIRTIRIGRTQFRMCSIFSCTTYSYSGWCSRSGRAQFRSRSRIVHGEMLNDDSVEVHMRPMSPVDKVHSDTEIPKLKSFMNHLALKLYAFAKSSRNRYVKNLVSDSSVVNRKVPRPFHILSWVEGAEWCGRDIPDPIFLQNQKPLSSYLTV